MVRALRPKGPIDGPAELDSAGLEGLVAYHLRTWIAYSRRDFKMYFWRTKSGNEVDFVAYGDDIFAAIEIKRAVQVYVSDLRGLKAFGEDYPEAKLMLLYLGAEPLHIAGIACLPLPTFLRQLGPRNPACLT